MSAHVKITLAPPPAGADLPTTLADDERARMLTAIHAAVWEGDASDELFYAVWDRSDGYGEPGTVPPQGYDWSGIRDSSDHAVAEMYAALGECPGPHQPREKEGG
jgi:hypothetical protein